MFEEMENISRVFRRYRFYYKLTDFILLSLILYSLSYYFNLVSLFPRYVEYYVIDAISMDMIIVFGLSALCSGLLLMLIYLRKSPVDPIDMITSRYEWLEDRLQTACDNKDQENVIVSDLRDQVTSCLQQVELSLFLDKKHLATRLVLSIVLAGSIIGLISTDTHLDVEPQDAAGFISRLGGELPEGIIPEADNTQHDGEDLIYGDTSVANIQGRDVELTIIPGLGTSVTIRRTQSGEDVQFVPSQTYPSFFLTSSMAADESYQALQQLSSENRDLIKDYAVMHSKLQESKL